MTAECNDESHFKPTLNLHGNCGASPSAVLLEERESFEQALKCRLREPVDSLTIDWIWEYARISKQGKHYSDQFRPTLPENCHNIVRCGLQVE